MAVKEIFDLVKKKIHFFKKTRKGLHFFKNF